MKKPSLHLPGMKTAKPKGMKMPAMKTGKMPGMKGAGKMAKPVAVEPKDEVLYGGSAGGGMIDAPKKDKGGLF
jgi:hypothetical protein